ncbi:hypothetical protein LG3211_4441 [Lysobacter gummosus]|nr:hypothetical protein LG3211_4441 [Lysobacter gummosus]
MRRCSSAEPGGEQCRRSFLCAARDRFGCAAVAGCLADLRGRW